MHTVIISKCGFYDKQEVHLTESIAEFFAAATGGNQYLTLFLLSVIPVVELRGAIVLMGGMTDINYAAGMFCCVAGSSCIIVPMVFVVSPLIARLKRSSFFGKMGERLEDHLETKAESVRASADKHDKKRRHVEAGRLWGLLAFVAVPLPMTGAWTGSAIGGILDLKPWKAVLAVFAGNLIAAGVLTLLVRFVPQGYMDFFLYGFIILAVTLFCSAYVAGALRRRKRKRAGKDVTEA